MRSDRRMRSTGEGSDRVWEAWRWGTHRKGEGRCLAAVLFSGVVLASASWGSAGTLDASFGTNGISAFPVGGRDDVARAVALQPDGKLVLGGSATNGAGNTDFALVRLNPDGSADTTFGTNGKTSRPVGSGDDLGYAIALQPDGKIVLTGVAVNSAGNFDFAATRFNVNGSPDPSFGNDGVVAWPLGQGHDLAYGVALQPDGKIVLGGEAINSAGNFDFAAMRLNPDGSLDPSFGSAGKFAAPIAAGHDRAFGLALQSDGKIVLGGSAINSSGNYDFAWMRLTPNGALDPSFGSGGASARAVLTSHDEATSVRVLPNGKILLGGSAVNSGGVEDFAVMRLSPDGTPDESFGVGGSRTTSIGSGRALAFGMAVQADGKVLLAGRAQGAQNDDFALVRYTADGSHDHAFGVNGIVTNPIGANNDGANGVLVQPDGKIVLAGYAVDSTGYQDFGVARYESDASDSGGPTCAAGAVVPHANPSQVYLPVTVSDAESGVQEIRLETPPTSNCHLEYPLGTPRAGNTLTLAGPIDSVTVFLVKNGVGRGTARLTATDGAGNTETCDLTINLPPTAGGDAYVVQRNVARSVLASGVLANDSDPDGDLFTAVLEDLPDHGTLSLDPNGAFTYTPAPGYTGEDSFSYRASDGIHLSSPATVLLTVVNTAPVALGNSHTGWRNCPLQVGVPGVLGNDSDADGDPLTASLVQGPVAGSLSLNPNGAFIYTPNPGTTGDSFTYRAFDGVDYSSPVTVTLTLQADTVKPTAVVGSVVSETSPVRVYVPVTVSDGQSGVVRVELTSNSSNCTLSVAGQAGSVLTFDPAMASVVVRAVKVDPTRGARVELKVTDCAGNAAIVDPVITELVIPAGARSVTQTYSGLPTAERYVEAQNRRPGVRLLSVRVNGVGGGVLKLAPGAVGKLDAARWMRAGDSNVFTLTAYGKPGARVLVIIGDSPGTGGGARTRSAAGAAARPGVNLNWGRD